jgi:two-component system, OmpR family, sensor kinase
MARLRPWQTLRARLAIAAAGTLFAAVALFGVVTVLLVGQELRSSLDRALSERAADVAQLAVSAPAVLTSPGALEVQASGRQIVVEVIDARGRIFARSLTLGARLLPQDALSRRALRSGATGFEDIELSRHQYRLYAAPIAQALGPVAGGAVLVASDTTDIRDTIGRLGVVVGVSGAAVALLAALGAAVLTRRGLRPLRRLAEAAGEIERTADPSRRLPEPAAADEIGTLTGVLNRMLSSLEQARAGERRFLADASHELRTPVTALLGNVEYAARYGADPEVLEELRADAARLARLVDALLVLERTGGSAPALEPLWLDRLVGDEVAAHDLPGRVLLGRIDRAQVLADRAELRRALANLIDNGLIHGPDGGTVTVTVTLEGDRVRVSVVDQGPGPDPDQRERLFERFWRGPNTSEQPGSGLGLSIVAAIAERHGGDVLVQGARFSIELPTVRSVV